MTDRPLAGRVVVVTREHPGRFARTLAGLGADVVNVPLIEIADPADCGAALREALSELDRYDWLVVTSPNGAARVSAARDAGVRLAAVGRATADALRESTGRAADLVPTVQRLDGLLASFPPHDGSGHGRALAVRGDRADPALVTELERLGWRVDDVVGYRTISRAPTPAERRQVAAADAVVFASGSAAATWAEAFDLAATTLPTVIVIGPSTAAVAREVGLDVAAVASEQSVDGLVSATVEALTS